jgi:hypothetical protein
VLWRESFQYLRHLSLSHLEVSFDYVTSAWKLCSFPYFTLVFDIVT